MRQGEVSFWNSETQDYEGFTMTWSQVMLMSSLLCASDEIAAESCVDPTVPRLRVFDLIFGQSIVNDAVSIILFQTVVHQYEATDETEFEKVAHSLFRFLLNMVRESFNSIVIGLLFAFACAYIMKKMRTLAKSPVGCTLIFCFGFLAYLTAELARQSGIIAILTSGMAMSNYAWYNLSPQGKQSSMTIFKFLGTIVEGAIFCYIGLTFWTYRDYRWSFELITS